MGRKVAFWEFSRLSHDFYNSEFYKAYSEFENTIYEIEELIKGDWRLLNNPIMLVFGDAGTGKVTVYWLASEQ